MKKYRSFDQFWPFYVREHSKKLTRVLHFTGTLGAIGCIAGSIVISPFLALCAPVVGYGFAWIAHFFVENNRPATFSYPLWSLRADCRMFGLMAVGRMEREADRVASLVPPD